METSCKCGGYAAVLKLAADRLVAGEPYKITATFGGIPVYLKTDSKDAEKAGKTLTFLHGGKITLCFALFHNYDYVGFMPVSFSVAEQERLR